MKMPTALAVLALLIVQCGCASQQRMAQTAIESKPGSSEREKVTGLVTDPDLLARVALDEHADISARRLALDRISDEGVLRKLALQAGDPLRYEAVMHTRDQGLLAALALEDRTEIRIVALMRLTDVKTLEMVLRSPTLTNDERLAAQLRIFLVDPDVIAAFGDLRGQVRSNTTTTNYIEVNAKTRKPVSPFPPLPRSVEDRYLTITIEDTKGAMLAHYATNRGDPNFQTLHEQLPAPSSDNPYSALLDVFKQLLAKMGTARLQNMARNYDPGRQAAVQQADLKTVYVTIQMATRFVLATRHADSAPWQGPGAAPRPGAKDTLDPTDPFR